MKLKRFLEILEENSLYVEDIDFFYDDDREFVYGVSLGWIASYISDEIKAITVEEVADLMVIAIADGNAQTHYCDDVEHHVYRDISYDWKIGGCELVYDESTTDHKPIVIKGLCKDKDLKDAVDRYNKALKPVEV